MLQIQLWSSSEPVFRILCSLSETPPQARAFMDFSADSPSVCLEVFALLEMDSVPSGLSSAAQKNLEANPLPQIDRKQCGYSQKKKVIVFLLAVAKSNQSQE